MTSPRKRRSPVDRIMEGMTRCAVAREDAVHPGISREESQQRWATFDQQRRRFKRLVQRVLREARQGDTHG